MNKYVKKAVEVEAIQFDGTDKTIQEIKEWGCPVLSISEDFEMKSKMFTLQNESDEVTVRKGTWIIKGTAEEFYPCPEHVFGGIYEAVE